MKPIGIIAVFAFAAAAAIDYGGHPSACQSRPCVYTISCSGMPRTGSPAEIQQAVDNAHRGDTIRLEAGCQWTAVSQPAVWIRRDPPGASGRVVITSTEEAKLPEDGVRITPVYWPRRNGPHSATDRQALGVSRSRVLYRHPGPAELCADHDRVHSCERCGIDG
jgi:hypothetical protein